MIWYLLPQIFQNGPIFYFNYKPIHYLIFLTQLNCFYIDHLSSIIAHIAIFNIVLILLISVVLYINNLKKKAGIIIFFVRNVEIILHSTLK